MARRRVTKTDKSQDGDITGLCGGWGKTEKKLAISEIESGLHEYYVEENSPPVDVIVVNEDGNKYLRTTPDKSNANNLDNLPDC